MLVSLLLITGSSFAQYKPEAKSISTEVQFNPFDQNGKTFRLDGLKVRYFITNKDAVRVKLGFNVTNNVITDKKELEDGGSRFIDESRIQLTSGDVNFNFGYERHFDLSKRFSAYIGAGLGANKHFVTTKINMENRHYSSSGRLISEELYKVKVSNGESNVVDDNFSPSANIGYWRFDASVFAGVDFYVYKGLYLGTEFGFGVKSRTNSKIKVLIESSSFGKPTEVTEEVFNDKIVTTEYGFYIEPTIRLGWTF